jgi:PIN like domain
LLDGRVGPPYSDDRLKQLYKEGEERYAKSKPPGYKDAKTKEGDKAFGDLVLWYQVIEKASSEKNPIIIVTDDVKEDWWWRHEGKIVGPNPELVEELHSKANVAFYMYVSDQFMEYARQYLKQDVDQEAIDEIREVRKHDEQQRLEIEQFLVLEESRLDAMRRDRHALAAELDHRRLEMSSLSEQMDHILLGPGEGRESPSARKLITDLASQRRELESRAVHLEANLRYLDQQIDLLKVRRNRLAHGRPTSERLRFRGARAPLSSTIEPAPSKNARPRADATREIEEPTDD